MNVGEGRNRCTTTVGIAIVAGALLASCSSKSGGAAAGPGADAGAGGADGMAAVPFEPLPPAVYGTKVKNLLVGQPLTDDELGMLAKDANALPGLVDTWMGQPQWRTRMFGFFQQAFQQTQTTAADFDDPPRARRPDVHRSSASIVRREDCRPWARYPSVWGALGVLLRSQARS